MADTSGTPSLQNPGSRDDEQQAWNEALARGDAAEIEAMQDTILRSIHTRIMDDDPTYGEAGWTVQPYPVPVAGGWAYVCGAGHTHWTEDAAEGCGR